MGADNGKHPAYKRSLGLFELVSLGVGGTIGSGIFVVPGIAAGIAGPASLIAWLIVAVSASCVLLSLSYVASGFTTSGSFYNLFSSVSGSRIAVPLIILYLISSIFGVSTIAAGIGQYITYFGIPCVLVIEMGIIAAFCTLNSVGISQSTLAENILTTMKIIPLVIIALLLLPFVRADNFIQTSPLTTAAFFSAVIIVYWPFTGFEISAIPVEETKDHRLIARSLVLVMIIVVVVYLLLNIALIGSAGSATLAASPAPIATAASVLFAYAGPLVAFIGIVAMLSALNAYIIGTSRVLQNISARFSVPLLMDLSRRGTPVAALVTGCTVSATLLLFSNHFNELASISVITTLIPYIFFCFCSWVLVPKLSSRIISLAGAASTAGILILFFLVK
ncbi:MAG: APC family permease [Methanoregula sp.]|nr:MAG: APC family permease [Methanoregula sp.]